MAVETDRRVQALLSLSGFGKIEFASAQSANDVGGVVAPDLSVDLQLGVSVRAATKQELEKANTPGGVYVFHVARMIGLQEGDILRAINGNAVNSVAEAASRCARLRSEEKISLEIVRNSAVKTISASLLGE